MNAIAATQPILDQVRERVAHFSAESGVDVSIQAQELIAAIFASFLFDPHHSWTVDQTAHLAHFERLMSSLPEMLSSLSSGRSDTSSPITSFEVLYWVTQHLADICPYVCPV